MHKVGDAFERLLLFVVPQTRTTWRDAPLGRWAGHLHHQQTGTPQSACAVVHQMKVVHHAIHRFVGGHG